MTDPTTFSIDVTDLLLILQGVIFGFAAILGFFLKYVLKTNADKMKNLEDRVKEVEGKADGLSVTVPTQYVTKLEFSRVIEALFDKMDAFTARLDMVIAKLSDQIVKNSNNGNEKD